MRKLGFLIEKLGLLVFFKLKYLVLRSKSDFHIEKLGFLIEIPGFSMEITGFSKRRDKWLPSIRLSKFDLFA